MNADLIYCECGYRPDLLHTQDGVVVRCPVCGNQRGKNVITIEQAENIATSLWNASGGKK